MATKLPNPSPVRTRGPQIEPRTLHRVLVEVEVKAESYPAARTHVESWTGTVERPRWMTGITVDLSADEMHYLAEYNEALSTVRSELAADKARYEKLVAALRRLAQAPESERAQRWNEVMSLLPLVR